jgi:hypothetical protein
MQQYTRADAPARGRSLEESASISALAPIHGGFISVSPVNRARSLSPRKRLPRQAHHHLHIRVNVTGPQAKDNESRLVQNYHTTCMSHANPCSMSTRHRERSPSPLDNGVAMSGIEYEFSPPFNDARRDPGSRNRREARLRDEPELTTTVDDSLRHQGKHRSDSKTRPGLKSSGRKSNNSGCSGNTTSHSRNKRVPDSIDTEDSKRYVTIHAAHHSPTRTSQPKTPEASPKGRTYDEDVSSIYSQDYGSSLPVGVLHIPSRRTIEAQEETATLLQSYGYLQQDPFPGGAAAPDHSPSLSRPKSHNHLRPSGSRPELQAAGAMDREQLYSPLAPYFAHKNFPIAKRGGKVMIGDNGWLERTPAGLGKKQKASPKKSGFIDSIKKKAREMVGQTLVQKRCCAGLTASQTAEMKTQRRSRDSDKEKSIGAHTAISLDPREQSLLYGELEYILSTALNHFISTQLSQGRLDPDKLKKVADSWSAKGRPRVVGFRYDVETQLELVALHSEDFRFYGRRQGNAVEIAGLLSAMRTNARAMRIRTFCQPDSVIGKQVCDAQSLLGMLGSSESQQIALAEVVQFFRVIVEREQAAKLQRDAREKGRKLPHGQGDWQWEPADQMPPGSDPYGGLLLVPEGYDVDSETLAYPN